jgi:predicted acylesterase/phospholipase RssA
MLELAIRHPIEPDITVGTFGLDSGKGLVHFIRRLLGIRQKLTLADVYRRTGKTLRICVCNLSKRRAEYWTHETHPTVSLVHALRISCSIPFVFSAVKFRGDLYVDGAVADHLPLASPEKTLAIGFDAPPKPIESMEDFVGALRTCTFPGATPRYFVKLDPSHIDPFDLSPATKDMRLAFAAGRRQASSWIKKIS